MMGTWGLPPYRAAEESCSSVFRLSWFGDNSVSLWWILEAAKREQTLTGLHQRLGGDWWDIGGRRLCCSWSHGSTSNVSYWPWSNSRYSSPQLRSPVPRGTFGGLTQGWPASSLWCHHLERHSCWPGATPVSSDDQWHLLARLNLTYKLEEYSDYFRLGIHDFIDSTWNVFFNCVPVCLLLL